MPSGLLTPSGFGVQEPALGYSGGARGRGGGSEDHPAGERVLGQLRASERVAKRINYNLYVCMLMESTDPATTSTLVTKESGGIVLMESTEASLSSTPSKTTADGGKKKIVAVYGGSFDPITNGHLNIAAEIIHMRKADEGDQQIDDNLLRLISHSL